MGAELQSLGGANSVLFLPQGRALSPFSRLALLDWHDNTIEDGFLTSSRIGAGSRQGEGAVGGTAEKGGRDPGRRREGSVWGRSLVTPFPFV